jgi:hypothetical protein
MYRGIFGAHVAHVLRRLVCDINPAHPYPSRCVLLLQHAEALPLPNQILILAQAFPSPIEQNSLAQPAQTAPQIRLCQLYGSWPQFVACTATIANSLEHFGRLVPSASTPVLVTEDGSPQVWSRD